MWDQSVCVCGGVWDALFAPLEAEIKVTGTGCKVRLAWFGLGRLGLAPHLKSLRLPPQAIPADNEASTPAGGRSRPIGGPGGVLDVERGLGPLMLRGRRRDERTYV